MHLVVGGGSRAERGVLRCGWYAIVKLAAALVLIACLLPSPALAFDPVSGWASTWGGPGSATNDCRYPWKDCTPRRVTSLDTGISIIVTPSQFCACEVPRTPHPDRLIDLGPAEWAALGLAGPGLWRVRVQLLTASIGSIGPIPDTSTLPSQKGSP